MILSTEQLTGSMIISNFKYIEKQKKAMTTSPARSEPVVGVREVNCFSWSPHRRFLFETRRHNNIIRRGFIGDAPVLSMICFDLPLKPSTGEPADAIVSGKGKEARPGTVRARDDIPYTRWRNSLLLSSKRRSDDELPSTAEHGWGELENQIGVVSRSSSLGGTYTTFGGRRNTH
jgi:hypothetical protein